MRRHTRLAGLGVVLDLVLFVASGRAELYCEQPVVHAGQVRNGTRLERRFTLVNRGAGAVEVIDVRSTCGCLTPRLDRRRIGPGQGATLLLEVNTLALAEGTQS